jgi:predicted AAA+ superfamily ATPase
MYDTQKETHNFLITGSARLDIYKRNGDSMMGRYHYWRLHPFTLDDLPKNFDSKQSFDNADVEGDEGAIFENLVATHLYNRSQME